MIRARRRFGQHFLHDPGVIARIVAAIDPKPGERLVEALKLAVELAQAA